MTHTQRKELRCGILFALCMLIIGISVPCTGVGQVPPHPIHIATGGCE